MLIFLDSSIFCADFHLTTTTHRDIVHRALERKKPFKDDGKDGYRDYLIWLTFLNVVHHYAMDEACFKSDFLAMEDRSQMSIIDNDWNKHYILAETPMELEISLEVIYDSTNKQIKSMDIESVEDAYADCLYCPY